MFVASAIFLTTGLFFCFTSLGIAHGMGFIFLGVVLFLITTYALALMLELKDSFLVNKTDLQHTDYKESNAVE